MGKREEIAEHNPEIIFYDGLEDALIGHVARYGMESVALYDREKCIKIFMSQHECDPNYCDNLMPDRGPCEKAYEEAVEHFDFNVIGGWLGEHTPAFAMLLPVGAENGA